MAKHKKKTQKKASHRKAKSCLGTPVKCKVQVGDGATMLKCGKMPPILLKAGKGGHLAPVPSARAAAKTAAKKQAKFIATAMPFAS